MIYDNRQRGDLVIYSVISGDLNRTALGKRYLVLTTVHN